MNFNTRRCDHVTRQNQTEPIMNITNSQVIQTEIRRVTRSHLRDAK